MSHAHLSVRHLLAQLQLDRTNRVRRDIRPDWLRELIEFAAELFDPADAVGRVGFDCRVDEAGWSASLYLGSVEMVGGRQDGQSRRAAFRFDLKPLLGRFAQIDEIAWDVDRQGGMSDAGPASTLSIAGWVGENRLRLTIDAVAPPASHAGLRHFPDGRYEVV